MAHIDDPSSKKLSDEKSVSGLANNMDNFPSLEKKNSQIESFTSNLSSNTSSQQSVVNSYANAMQFPKKDQAIILESVEGITLDDYMQAVGEIVGYSKVVFASKISKQRVRLWLSSKETMTSFTSSHEKVSIKGKDISVRPFVIKHSRIIISNLTPEIPHTIVEEYLDNIKVKRGSSVSFLKAGGASSMLKHVLSERRQVYVDPSSTIPGKIEINFEGKIHRAFLSSDSIKCYLCSENGHIARACPRNNNNIDEDFHLIDTANTEQNINKQSEIELSTKSNTLEINDKDNNISIFEHADDNEKEKDKFAPTIADIENTTKKDNDSFVMPNSVSNNSQKRPRLPSSSISSNASVNEYMETNKKIKNKNEKKKQQNKEQKIKTKQRGNQSSPRTSLGSLSRKRAKLSN